MRIPTNRMSVPDRLADWLRPLNVFRGSRRKRRLSRIEYLEQRVLLTTFDPSRTVVDGAVGSLRDAVQQANSNGEDDVIRLSAGIWQIDAVNAGRQDNLNLRGDFDLRERDRTVIIEGAGAGVTIIDANSHDRVFHVGDGVRVVIRNLTIVNGLAVDDGFPESTAFERTASGGAIL